MQDANKLDKYMPHWWLAAVVHPRDKEYPRRMVHVDICGSAFDSGDFVCHEDGRLASLAMFVTSEHITIPSMEQIMHEFFGLQSFAGSIHSSTPPNVAPQLCSERHLRALHRKDASTVLAIPLASFLNKTYTKKQAVAQTACYRLKLCSAWRCFTTKWSGGFRPGAV